MKWWLWHRCWPYQLEYLPVVGLPLHDLHQKLFRMLYAEEIAHLKNWRDWLK